MSAAPIFCAACGIQNPREAAFCNGCGARLTLPAPPPPFAAPAPPAAPAPAAEPEHPVTTLGKHIATETGKEVVRQVIIAPLSLAISAAVLAIAATIGALLLAIWLGAQNAARSTPGWFVLTWPLTLAAAVIVLLARRSLKDSLAIVPVGAIILIGAAWLGSTVGGTVYYTAPSPYEDEPGGSFISLALGVLQRMYDIYGANAFVAAIIIGALVGVIVDRVVPEGITQEA